MQVVHPVGCGIEVPAVQLTAYLRRVSKAGQTTTAVSTPTPLS